MQIEAGMWGNNWRKILGVQKKEKINNAFLLLFLEEVRVLPSEPQRACRKIHTSHFQLNYSKN